MAMNQGMGHKDLDELATNPCDLKFTIELLKVETPEEYEKEIWQMSAEEMLEKIPHYKEEGNILYSKKMFSESAIMYSKALTIIEQLLLIEKPGDEEWNRLDAMKIPLLCNLSQCELIEGDFYAVIEHTNEVLKRDNRNVKALFRRAKANFSVWNLENARNDHKKCFAVNENKTK
jgi:AH receptor-interacting protein